jgi:tripartite ATP-independent transporter DctP family solute receptor
MKNFFATFFAIGLIFLSTGCFSAQELKLGVVTKPGSAQNIAAEKFKELLESRSGGKYTVRIYHSSSIGNETEILQQLQMGSIELGIITDGPFDTFSPMVRVINYPFLFKDNQQADRILDGPLGKQILDSLEKVGMKGLAFSENGFRDLTNSKRPVHAADDVKGLKIRVMSSLLHKSIWQALGANPTPMPWPIYSELEQHVVDGQENPLWVMEVYGIYDVQKYLTITRHVYSAHIDTASLVWWKTLGTDDQRLIQQCMYEAALFQRMDNREKDSARLAMVKAKGMVVDEQPDLASFRTKVAQLQNIELYSDPEVHKLLLHILDATK